ncbi:hypothetical protein MSL71_3550 [Desulfoluna butyratoxydans]|uniref:Uncharacterized protein n=1 Tax=Desulfoluna butyratoxydans TaxID=231438 RepID=A0A4U8YHS5_9BACT|nr:hypothetical protein MSL71_3550 [Desulfoluna butyratoxydans]
MRQQDLVAALAATPWALGEAPQVPAGAPTRRRVDRQETIVPRFCAKQEAMASARGSRGTLFY